MRLTAKLKIPYSLIVDIQKDAEDYLRYRTKTLAIWLYEEVRANWSITKPSNPFRPPAIDTGAFDASINYHQNRTSAGRFASGFSVVFNTDKSPDGEQYAQALEFGTIKADPRPYLEPALESLEREFRGVRVTKL